MYYKLKALRRAGWHVTLHTYAYGEREHLTDGLADVADDVHIYRRDTGLLSHMSRLPYIVRSRRDSRLVTDLLADDAPILFEGLHTCLPLADPRLDGRIKVVRAHNVEHDYYRGLALATHSWRERLYYRLEADKLQQYEPILGKATAIAAISEADRDYFARKYPDIATMLMPCFFDDTPPSASPGRGDYVLYQGNLAVKENALAARWIIDRIAWRMPHVNFVIAGSRPEEMLSRIAAAASNVTLIADPDNATFETLLRDARVNLLITFQPTGIKLKLLNALCRGAHVVANPAMVHGTGLEDYVTAADTPDGLIEAINSCMDTPFGGRQPLPDIYNPIKNIAALTGFIRQKI